MLTSSPRPRFGALSRWPSCVVLLAGIALLSAAGERPIKRPVYDASVPAVGLFEAIDNGTVKVSVFPKNAFDVNVLVTNASKHPVSIQMPPAVVAVQVLKQFGQPGGNFFGQVGTGAAGGNGATGTGQPIGGPTQTGTGNGPGNNGVNGPNPGIGFFSIPAEKTVQLKLKTVCLAHGKPEPRPKMTYELVRIEQFTKDATLPRLLALYGKSGIDPQAMQAAAWHVVDKMSWKALEEKRREQTGVLDPDLYFTPAQIKAAKELVGQAQEAVRPVAETAAVAVPKL